MRSERLRAVGVQVAPTGLSIDLVNWLLRSECRIAVTHGEARTRALGQASNAKQVRLRLAYSPANFTVREQVGAVRQSTNLATQPRLLAALAPKDRYVAKTAGGVVDSDDLFGVFCPCVRRAKARAGC